MRIRRLFSSVLAALALMYASGCNETCQQVAGYNVGGAVPYTYGTQVNTQAIAYNAAYNPGYAPAYNSGIAVAPAPAAVAYQARRPAVKRTKTRYTNTRPTKQRFTQQVNPYVYGQPYAAQTVVPTAAAATNFNYVPTVTFNTDGVSGLTTAGVAQDVGGVSYQPNVGYQGYQPVQATTYAPQVQPIQPVVQPMYDYSIPSGANVQSQTVYRRGRPIRQRYRKVRWIPTQPVQQYAQPLPPAPIYSAPIPVTTTYTPPPVMEPYIPPAEPISIPEPVPAPPPEPVVIKQEISPVISPVIEPRIQPTIEPHIKPIIEPVIQPRIEAAPVVEQPVQQPIVQPVVIQPIIQPVIQAPIQEYQAPVQIAAVEPAYVPPPAPAYVPPPMPMPMPEPAPSGYCPPDICPAPNPMVCQPGQNLSECFTLNDYQVMNSPTQIYTPNSGAPLAVSVNNAIIGSMDMAVDPGLATMNAMRGEPTASIAGPAGQTTTSKYEALPIAAGTMDSSSFGMVQQPMQQQMVQQQMIVQQPSFGQPAFGQPSNIPPVPAATEIENALDAMLSRDQMTPNLK